MKHILISRGYTEQRGGRSCGPMGTTYEKMLGGIGDSLVSLIAPLRQGETGLKGAKVVLTDLDLCEKGGKLVALLGNARLRTSQHCLLEADLKIPNGDIGAQIEALEAGAMQLAGAIANITSNNDAMQLIGDAVDAQEILRAVSNVRESNKHKPGIEQVFLKIARRASAFLTTTPFMDVVNRVVG